jgi:hypothetical protein
MKTIEQRFWEKVAIKDPDQCWGWQAACRADGYGVINIEHRILASHRVSWEMHYKKQIPAGLFVLHKCDNRKCVNPRHLFLGTHQDNMDDLKNKGYRQPARGEHTGSAKLTYDKVRQIKELYKTGKYSHRKLAKMFGVLAHVTIGKILRGERWL